jgi:hypothetical protein
MNGWLCDLGMPENRQVKRPGLPVVDGSDRLGLAEHICWHGLAGECQRHSWITGLTIVKQVKLIVATQVKNLKAAMNL